MPEVELHINYYKDPTVIDLEDLKLYVCLKCGGLFKYLDLLGQDGYGNFICKNCKPNQDSTT